jgi:hypothetical protein
MWMPRMKNVLNPNLKKQAKIALRDLRGHRLSIPARTEMTGRLVAEFVAESNSLEGYTTTSAEVIKAAHRR